MFHFHRFQHQAGLHAHLLMGHRGGGRGRGGLEGGRERWGRMFGHGDLRLVILYLLEQKPRHGYDIIKALEELSQGHYSPSPGVIYPTLTYLEESGHAAVDAEAEGSKKCFRITEAGRAWLDENREFITALMNRLAHKGEILARLKERFGRGENGHHAEPIRNAIQLLRSALREQEKISAAGAEKIAAILQRAATDIRAVTDNDAAE